MCLFKVDIKDFKAEWKDFEGDVSRFELVIVSAAHWTKHKNDELFGDCQFIFSLITPVLRCPSFCARKTQTLMKSSWLWFTTWRKCFLTVIRKWGMFSSVHAGRVKMRLIISFSPNYVILLLIMVRACLGVFGTNLNKPKRRTLTSCYGNSAALSTL